MKLSIIGAGAVGSATAFAAAINGIARDIVIQDINKSLAVAQAMDIEHGSSFYPTASITGTDDIEAVEGSDIIVVTAGAKQLPGQSRIELAATSIDIIKKIIPPLVEKCPHAKFILVSNPVDVITYVAQKISGLPETQIFGSGTWLDSSRLRSRISDWTGVNAKNVHAYIVGEHGDSEIPFWSSATIGNVPIREWVPLSKNCKPLTSDVLDQIYHDVVNAAYHVIEGKGATNYAIALATCDIISAIAKDENRVMPVSTLVNPKCNSGYIEGVSDVCLSLPRILGKDGIVGALACHFNVDELDGLQKSATVLRDTLKQNGF
ncbi:MAG: L-lactate dehydrogenase [Candidatus Ancillula sp.]|jgi:L-lactate dehydrogenase|nr:L-lactate dehydrogenase [Candidatus Ancillula sp.]